MRHILGFPSPACGRGARGEGRSLGRALAFVCLSLAGAAWAGEPAPAETDAAPAYTRTGADTCLKCHDDKSDPRIAALFRTPHAVKSDARTPFGQLQCESCHGPGGDHARRVRFGETRPPIPVFGRNSPAPVEKKNEVCLGCHENHERAAWSGSAHDREGVACTDCHKIHADPDPVTTLTDQPGVCFTCHTRERAESLQFSTHPIRYGRMNCTECHEPHGSVNDALLKRPTLNETCYTCHADKRGPFLWEHAPVPEDCTLCHRAHGSNQPALLTMRPPLLCQQCHERSGHPSVPRTGADLPDGNPSGFLLAGACLNCHGQVHGSNHPSGANLSR